MLLKEIKTDCETWEIVLVKGMYSMPRMTRNKAIRLYGEYRVLSITEFHRQGIISVVVRK